MTVPASRGYSVAAEPYTTLPDATGAETPRQAAARELTEETGRQDEPEDELFLWTHDFRFAGEYTRQAETYFVAWTDDLSLPLTGPDLSDGISRRTWFDADEIAKLTEPVWPPDLGDHLRRLQLKAD